MPQLDLMTYSTQFFWFSLGFSFFYICLLHFVMPSIAFNLKFRKRKLDMLAGNINKKRDSVPGVLDSYDSILIKTLLVSRNYVSKITNYGTSWVSLNTTKANLNNFTKANKAYMKTVGERNFSFILLDTNLKSSSKDKNWTKLWKK